MEILMTFKYFKAYYKVNFFIHEWSSVESQFPVFHVCKIDCDIYQMLLI